MDAEEGQKAFSEMLSREEVMLRLKKRLHVVEVGTVRTSSLSLCRDESSSRVSTAHSLYESCVDL